jgi:hypothetical protein
MTIIIEKVKLDDILTLRNKRFNTNNHSLDTPIDYYEILENSNIKYWIDKFRTDYIIINLDKKYINWMKKANEIGKYTGEFPNMFQEELEEFLNNHKHLDYIFNLNNKYFVRAEKVSLKYGKHGAGPYTNLRDIIESLVTCIETHSPLKNIKDSSIKLYLFPWIEMNEDLEFRIFVYNNKITAISQQNIYQRNEYLLEYDEEKRNIIINNWINIINNYFNDVIKKNINHTYNYTIDLALLDDNKPYFIEINSFGKDYAAGSALYHWIIDDKILLDIDRQINIYFRYVII